MLRYLLFLCVFLNFSVARSMINEGCDNSGSVIHKPYTHPIKSLQDEIQKIDGATSFLYSRWGSLMNYSYQLESDIVGNVPLERWHEIAELTAYCNLYPNFSGWHGLSQNKEQTSDRWRVIINNIGEDEQLRLSVKKTDVASIQSTLRRFLSLSKIDPKSFEHPDFTWNDLVKHYEHRVTNYG